MSREVLEVEQRCLYWPLGDPVLGPVEHAPGGFQFIHAKGVAGGTLSLGCATPESGLRTLQVGGMNRLSKRGAKALAYQLLHWAEHGRFDEGGQEE